MKKRWKVFWIMCISLGILGIALCISGILLGATMETVRGTFGIMDVNAHFWGNHYGGAGDAPSSESGEFSESHDGDAEGYDDDAGGTESSTFYWRERFSDIRELKIDVTHLDVEIDEWDDNEVFVDTSDMNHEILKDLEVSRKNGELKIEMKNKKKWENLVHSVYESEGTLLIRVPSGLRFEEASVKVGAGRLTADRLQAEELKIEVGAGQVYLDSFTAEEFDLECGAGEADVYGETLKKVKIECGVGTVTYSAAGSQTDYNYEVECGIGSVTVGGDTYSGFGNERKINNGGSRMMEIECGIGRVDVSFDG